MPLNCLIRLLNPTMRHYFGPFCLDENDQVLLRAGRRVPLPAKVVSTLIVLVRHQGHVVGKDDLMKEVWPNEFVEEGNLAQHIFMLRKAFGETAGGPKYIETVPRRGYRFLGASTETNNTSAPVETSHASRSVHSVAVLPFINDSDDPPTEYLADSLTESLINNLSQLQQILVRPRSTVFRYKTREIDVQQAGHELGVHSVIIGKVHLAGESLVIGTELVDVAGGWQVFGKTYRFKSNEIQEAQEKIANDITAVLPVGQSADERRITSRFTGGSSAHEAYLKGRLCWSKHTREGLEQATEYFRQAIEFDPGYVLPYAALVDCFLRLATDYLLPADSLPAAAVAAEAETIEELSAECLASVKLRCEWDKKCAERELRRATELKSSYPAIHQWNAACVFAQSLYLDTLFQNGSAPTRQVRASDQFQPDGLTLAEEIQVSCLIAREQIVLGNFEAARLVLKKWYTVGQWPELEKLSPHSFADLLFTAGKLASNLARTSQVPKAQKHAEALLNGAIGIWEQLGLKRQSAEVQMELGICYWREGLIDLARSSVKTALKQLDDQDSELRGLGLIRMAIVEMAGCLHEALACLNEAAAFIDQAGPLLTSIYNSEMGVVNKHLGVAENRNDYFERGKSFYREALYQFEAIGSYLYVAFTENNYVNLLVALEQFEEAEPHIKRARKWYERGADKVYSAQFDDTRARFYIATEQFEFAEQVLAESIETFEDSGQAEHLAQSLTTQGMLLCRLGRHRQAKRVLQRAYEIAESGGNRSEAERALLFLIEQMHDKLDADERRELRAALDRLFASPQQTSPDERRQRCLQLIT